MTAPTAPATSGPGASRELAEPESRGTLDIDPSVLRKIVEHAADQAPGTRRRRRSVAGVGMGDSRPSAKIQAYSDGVEVRLNLALAYPAPIRATVADVRERISRDLEHMAGLSVRSLTVDVAALQGDQPVKGPRVA